MGRGPTQEPQCHIIYFSARLPQSVFLPKPCHDFLLHQNLPLSTDVENILGTIWLHDRRSHRRRQSFIIFWLSFAETSPMIILLVYLFFLMSILNPMTIQENFYYS